MFKKSKQLGFTLIELLVVIAIIGVLASIILVALNSARNKGNDAKVKSNLASLRTQAAVYFDTNEKYAVAANNTCAGDMFGDSTIAQILLPANYPWLVAGDFVCRATAGPTGGFAVAIKTISTAGAWCVVGE